MIKSNKSAESAVVELSVGQFGLRRPPYASPFREDAGPFQPTLRKNPSTLLGSRNHFIPRLRPRWSIPQETNDEHQPCHMNRDIGGFHSISCATLVPRAAQWQQMLP
jgi:hypothetical protein